MDKLSSITAYYCINYPHKNELSKARLTKLVYLADWFSAIFFNKQMTSIEWIFNHYGPYVNDIALNAYEHPELFSISCSLNCYGAEKALIEFIGSEDDIELSGKEKKVLDAIIEKTKTMYFNEFIDYVYSTYPIRSNERYSHLNLNQIANDYRIINNISL